MLRTKAIATSLGLIGLGLAAVPAPAQAASIVTFTNHESFTESFSDESVICQTELYKVTVEGRTITHLTLDTDTGMFRFTDNFRGTATEVPLDRTGVSYTATFFQFDLETIRSVRHGDVLAEVDSDVGHYVAHGDDGSQVRQLFHAHFTINANGDVTTEFFVSPLIADPKYWLDRASAVPAGSACVYSPRRASWGREHGPGRALCSIKGCQVCCHRTSATVGPPVDVSSQATCGDGLGCSARVRGTSTQQRVRRPAHGPRRGPGRCRTSARPRGWPVAARHRALAGRMGRVPCSIRRPVRRRSGAG